MDKAKVTLLLVVFNLLACVLNVHLQCYGAATLTAGAFFVTLLQHDREVKR